jgi:signal transduction histidine kinase
MHGQTPLRLQVGAFFAAVVVAFVGVNLMVMLAVWPQVRRLEHLYGDLGQCLHLLAQMRGAAQNVRSIAMSSVLRASQGHPGAPEEAGAELAAQLGVLSRLGAAYGPLVEAADEAETWSAIRDGELPSLATQAAGIVEAVRGSGGASPEAAEELRARSRRVDGLFQQLAHINASQVQQSAQGIDAALRRLLVFCGLLLVVGGAGAALLLARSLSLIRRYAAVMDARLSELDAFASRVAHDLRSPLQTISLSLASIGKRTADDAVRTTAERAQGGVRRLNAMIGDLLEFARSGATPEPGVSAELPAVFEELREELRPVADAAGVRLTLDAEPGLRAAASGVAIRGIVANLVENGVKYMRDGSDRTVTARARARGRLVHIEVRDTGIGIPHDRLPTIFDPFVRARARRDSYGLGLATVKRLVDAHSGTVRVESEEGVGTVFVVELPRALDLSTIQAAGHSSR